MCHRVVMWAMLENSRKEREEGILGLTIAKRVYSTIRRWNTTVLPGCKQSMTMYRASANCSEGKANEKGKGKGRRLQLPL